MAMTAATATSLGKQGVLGFGLSRIGI